MKFESELTSNKETTCTCKIDLEKLEQFYMCIDCDTSHHAYCQNSTYSRKTDPIHALIKDCIGGIEKLCQECSYRRRNNIPKIDRRALLRARIAHMRKFAVREKELIRAHITAEEQRYNNKQ